IGNVYLINDSIYGSNADAVSSSSNLLIADTTLGGTAAGQDVYNGVENFDLGAPQQTVIQDSTIMAGSDPSNPPRNGIAYIGLATSSLTVTNTQIENNEFGILFSETAHNVTIQNDTFTNNSQSMIDSILGLYPQYPTGFGDFLIQGNTFSGSGAAYYCQAYGSGYDFPNLVLKDNTVTNGVLIQGAFNGTFTGFIVDGNTIGAGAASTWDWQGNVALWTNTMRLPG